MFDMIRAGVLAVLVAVLLTTVASAAPKPTTEFRYRWEDQAMLATYTCDDGTIIPGPHPVAKWGRGSQWVGSLSAHGIDKLHNALQTYVGLGLTDDAKAFLRAALPTIQC